MHTSEDVIDSKGWLSEKSALRSPWVQGWLAMLVVVFSVNIAFVTVAIKTAPDLTVEDYYERGKNFKEMLHRRAQEKALQWKADIIVPDVTKMNVPTNFQFSIADATGKAIIADSVTFYAYRPSDADADFSVKMNYIEDGLYGADISFSLPGSWDLIVSVMRDGDKLETPTRLSVEK